MNNNYKSIGDLGQNCVIGHFSKFGIGISIILSDNYPFDFIAIIDNKLFKVQVKSSSFYTSTGAISFDLKTNNFYNGNISKYSKYTCDVIACYNIVRDEVYILSPSDFENKSSITIRVEKSKNNQLHCTNWIDDYILSPKRIKKVFGCEPTDLNNLLSYKNSKSQYKNLCLICGQEFESAYIKAKCCSNQCKNKYTERERKFNPSKEELEKLVNTIPMTQIGKKYGVTDNSIRKRCKQIGIVVPKFGAGYWAKIKSSHLQLPDILKNVIIE